MSEDLIEKLDKGATALLKGVEDTTIDFKDRAAIFSAVVKYLQVKHKLKPDDEDGEGGIDDLKRRLKTSPDAGTGVGRASRKRGAKGGAKAASHEGGPFWRAAAAREGAEGHSGDEAGVAPSLNGGVHPGGDGDGAGNDA